MSKHFQLVMEGGVMCSQNERSISKEKLLSPKAKVTLLILTIMLMALFLVMPVQPAHAEESTTIDGVTYTYWTDSNAAAITSIKTTGSPFVELPAQIAGKPVKYLRCNFSNEERIQGVKSLDLSKCTSLTEINIINSKITSLNASGLRSLESLRCTSTKITSLEVSGSSALKTLDCQSNMLTSLNVSGLVALKTLYCSSNALTSLNVSDCSKLETLSCSNNRISQLNAANCTSLKYFTRAAIL